MVVSMKYIKHNTLGCFSPPVMLATFFIEISLAIYVNWKYKFDNITKLVIAILFFLSVFQLSEWNVCEGAFGLDSLSWARVGFVAITMLPPLGFHLATRLAGEKRTVMIATAYTTAAMFAAFFAFSGQGIVSQACLGNYAIFKSVPGAMNLYAAYYYGWLIVGTAYCLYMAREVRQSNRAGALRALAVGYLVFILPTTLANVLDHSTVAGIPSIMCGFAVFLALILAGEVLPRYYRQPTWLDYAKGIAAQRSNGKTAR